MSKNIKDISSKSEKIVVMLEQKPNKITQVYDGFDFYLPQTIKILDQYVSLLEKEKLTQQEQKFMDEFNQILDYIEQEIDKLLENMNYTKMLDINASVEMFMKSHSKTVENVEKNNEGSDKHA